jgi:transaldolase/glucose-6-phosphate isomerase
VTRAPETTPDVLHGRVAARLRDWQADGFGRRLWAKDATLWSSHPVPEITDRLGWLHLPETVADEVAALAAFARETAAAGTRHVVLLGMGGSSLAPEVFQQTFGAARGHPALTVLDSTHPGAVRAVEAAIALPHTLFVVSSKSGTTTETLSLFRYFWQRVAAAVPQPGAQFVAITDPKTPLARLAAERAFRRCWLAPPDVGGRYSALSVFGLLPAALIGVDVARLLDRARTMARACGPSVAVEANPGLQLGATIGEAVLAGRDKLVLVTSPRLAALPSWIEQLVAESTGKDGKGIVPVVSSLPEPAGRDSFIVYTRERRDDARDLDAMMSALEELGLPLARVDSDADGLGAEFFRWKVAVASAGAILGIHPFNQPDVQLAKDLATRAMEAASTRDPSTPGTHDEVPVGDAAALARTVNAWLAGVREGDYVAVQAYLAPTPQTTAVLEQIRERISQHRPVATTLGYGPRFLHSTGQLHKGGPQSGVFLQLVDDPEAAGDLPVPETRYTFGALIRAQALGDLQALRQRGRRVLRVHVGRQAAAGLERFADALRPDRT